jgi:leucyl/phenylalanyl-tRNA--protein transferase
MPVDSVKDAGRDKLTAQLVVQAYRAGFFPMADAALGEIHWYSPDPRAIIPLDQFNIPRSLQRFLREGHFEFRVNTAFREVMEKCATRTETWISNEIIRVYSELRDGGLAHSVETWHEGSLVGGLYGIALGGAFFGESMFSEVSNASKSALVWLVSRLRERNFVLLDTQFLNDHLVQFGTIEIPKSEYISLLQSALKVDASFA